MSTSSAYERRLGRLQAHSFSYSGNPQGCDHVDPAPAHGDRDAPDEAEPATGAGGNGRRLRAAGEPGDRRGGSDRTAPAPMNMAPMGPAIPGRSPALPSTSTGGAVIPLTAADAGR